MLYLLCIAATPAPGWLPPGMSGQLSDMDQPPPGMGGPTLSESTLLKFARNSSCSSGTCTFDCAIGNHLAQVAAAPGYYYAQANNGLSESNSKQPLSATWEPLLEAVPGCNGLGNGELLEVSYLVVLDASWMAYYQQHEEDFAAQGYATLEASPRLMFDRVSYLFEAQAPRAARTLDSTHSAIHPGPADPTRGTLTLTLSSLPERSSVFASQSAASKPLQTSLRSAHPTTRSSKIARGIPATPTTPWSSAASPMPRASRVGLCDSGWGPLMA